MRVAAIADVHGNLPALEAVLADLEEEAPDMIVIAGDVVPGPMPAETIDLLRMLSGARFVRGNGERNVVEAFDDPDWSDRGPAEIVELTRWNARRLAREQRDVLAAFEPRVEVEIEGLGRVLFCHGSPRSEDELVTAATPEKRLLPMLSGVTADVVVFAHTHMQVDRRAAGIRLVNPGSVGMPYARAAGAYWAVLGPDVVMRTTEYDLEAAAARIRASGAPGAEEFARENVLTTPSPEEALAAFEP